MALLACLATLLFFQSVPKNLRWPVRIISLGALLWLAYKTIRGVLFARWTKRKLLFTAILGAFYYGILTFVCHIFIKLMSAKDERIATRVVTQLADEQRHGINAMLDGTSFEQYDREIGWLPRPGKGLDGATISPQGLRSLKEYAIPTPDPDKRILCLGDSFTYGTCVTDTETYPYYAAELKPGTEWVNLGIAGACATQALLHYRKAGRNFGGKYVVIGFMTDDAKRTVNCFRPFLTQFNPFTKPFAKYVDGKFSIEPNPYQDISDFKKLLSNEKEEIERLLTLDYLTWSNQKLTRNPILRTVDYIYETMDVDRNIDGILGRTQVPKSTAKPKKSDEPIDPYGRKIWDPENKRWSKKPREGDPYGKAIWDPESPGFIAVTKVLDTFYSDVLADGRVPLIVIIPGPLDVENHVKNLPRVYTALTEHLQAKNYRFFDFLDPLVKAHAADLSIDTLYFQRHFKAPLNRELAAEIIKELQLP